MLWKRFYSISQYVSTKYFRKVRLPLWSCSSVWKRRFLWLWYSIAGGSSQTITYNGQPCKVIDILYHVQNQTRRLSEYKEAREKEEKEAAEGRWKVNAIVVLNVLIIPSFKFLGFILVFEVRVQLNKLCSESRSFFELCVQFQDGPYKDAVLKSHMKRRGKQPVL